MSAKSLADHKTQAATWTTASKTWSEKATTCGSIMKKAAAVK